MNTKELIVYAFASVRGATTLSFMFLLSANPLISYKEAQIVIFNNFNNKILAHFYDIRSLYSIFNIQLIYLSIFNLHTWCETK